MKEWKHKCLGCVLTYRPDPFRDELGTVGFVLFEAAGDPRRIAIRFAPDLRLLQCINVQEDTEMIREILLELEPELRSLVSSFKDANQFILDLTGKLSEQLNLSRPVAILTNDFDAEVMTQERQLFRPLDLSVCRARQTKNDSTDVLTFRLRHAGYLSIVVSGIFLIWDSSRQVYAEERSVQD